MSRGSVEAGPSGNSGPSGGDMFALRKGPLTLTICGVPLNPEHWARHESEHRG